MRDRMQAANDARIVMGTEEGERLIGYLLDFCHVFKASMGADCDPNRTLFNEGQRSVGNEIVALIVNDADRFKPQTLRKVTSLAEGTDI
ncbi:hypothetical protein GOB02_21705 [Sinorhizobium meliloti]|nr:hypothetical protein [Sinorhizobium meliloti]